MPGKVNPVLPEMMMQVAFRVIGNDATVTRAAEGELDLNVWESIILEAVSESIRLMRRATPLFVSGCIVGMEVNAERCHAHASSSIALTTALASIFGYPGASAVARHAEARGIPVSLAAVECGLMSRADADDLFADVSVFTDPEQSERVIAKFRKAASLAKASQE